MGMHVCVCGGGVGGGGEGVGGGVGGGVGAADTGEIPVKRAHRTVT